MIAIIDYEAGNLFSVERAVRKSGFDCKITMDKDEGLRPEKVSINSAAIRNPQLIAEGARAFGSQCIVLGIDAKRVSGPILLWIIP